MLRISCSDIAKKYVKEVLFKDFNYTFEQNGKYAILGSNSSGKSTLLKIIGKAISPNMGEIVYSLSQGTESLVSFCSPEMHLLDDFTVREMFELHFNFKKAKLTKEEQWEISGLKSFLDKKYIELSSGLKNKVKLTLALFSDTPALLLDEPCTNFDEVNLKWYNEMIDNYCSSQLIIVASNQEIEYHFCKNHINLRQFKPNLK